MSNAHTDLQAFMRILDEMIAIVKKGNIDQTSWDNLMRFSDQITKHVGFRSALSSAAQGQLSDFIKDFSNWQPYGNPGQDIPNFKQYLQKPVLNEMTTLAKALKQVKLPGQAA
jgi:hypothetical protein